MNTYYSIISGEVQHTMKTMAQICSLQGRSDDVLAARAEDIKTIGMHRQLNL
jgi:hypothetical protein